MAEPAVFRFAPSPNGRLHLGHALSAVVGHDWAQMLGGRFLVRIEDIDLARTREEHVSAIFEDLAWLGLDWGRPVLRQSEHFADYQAAADKLAALGLLYPCFATRTDIAATLKGRKHTADPDGAPLYPHLHKHLDPAEIAERKARGEPFALRLHMDRALELAARKLRDRPLTFTELGGPNSSCSTLIKAKPERWGDVVIVRKDVPTSYHLSVVVDDARQGITHVTRGRDLFAATDLHRLLQVLLDLPEPLYHHHGLITDIAGRKLAKSAGDTSLATLRGDGLQTSEVRAMIEAALAAGLTEA